MSDMKKIILSLFIALSVLFAPVAHASGMSCDGDNNQISKHSKMQSESEKHDDGKMAEAGHHCCCPHVSAISNLTVVEPMTVSSRIVFIHEADATTSEVVGLTLKPPSHA